MRPRAPHEGGSEAQSQEHECGWFGNLDNAVGGWKLAFATVVTSASRRPSGIPSTIPGARIATGAAAAITRIRGIARSSATVIASGMLGVRYSVRHRTDQFFPC